MTDLICWNCGETLRDIPRPISRRATCPACFTEVRCCRMCRHFDPSITTGQCAEERAEPPLNKETANFCEWYEPDQGAAATGPGARQDQARAKLDALFGRSAPPPEADENQSDDERGSAEQARAKLDALFANKHSPKE